MRRLEVALTSLLTIAAVTVAAAVAKKAFSDSAPGVNALKDRKLDEVEWESLLRISHPLRDTSGTVNLVVMADFECPACKRFHETLLGTFANGSGKLDVRYVHLPLAYHRAALSSARLFECGLDEPGVSERLADLFFLHQDSLALLGWREFARRAGSSDPKRMAQCAATDQPARFHRITQGIEIAERIKNPGTPAVILDGVLQATPPGETRLREIAGFK